METFDSNRSVIDINEISRKNADIVSSLIAAHALSGCDSVPKLFGIGKKTVVKILKQNISLTRLGNTNSPIKEIYEESSRLVAACYGVKNETSLSKVRFTVCGKRTGKKLTSTPKLESLPPTTEVFLLNVLCAHFQACIWNSCLLSAPPVMDPCKVSLISSDHLFFSSAT